MLPYFYRINHYDGFSFWLDGLCSFEFLILVLSRAFSRFVSCHSYISLTAFVNRVDIVIIVARSDERCKEQSTASSGPLELV